MSSSRQKCCKRVRHPRIPEVVRRWAATTPAWLKVASTTTPVEIDVELGPGELHAVALAKELRADWLLMDDRDGTRLATRGGLRVAGTLAVLEHAAKRNLLDLPQALERLKLTNFRVAPRLIEAALKRIAASRATEG